MFLLNRWSLERDADPAARDRAQLRALAHRVREPQRARHPDLRHPADAAARSCGSSRWTSPGTRRSGGCSSWWRRAMRCWRWASSGDPAVALRADEDAAAHHRAARPGQAGCSPSSMLNIYLCFAEFLIIWSGNIPDELPWYLNRIHGGWWTICSLDFICHWLIPFVPAALARPEAQQAEDDLDHLLHDLRALRGHVLADRAELQGRCRKPGRRAA